VCRYATFAHEDGDGYVAGTAEKGLNYAGVSYGGAVQVEFNSRA
jgi:hypothetical protein